MAYRPKFMGTRAAMHYEELLERERQIELAALEKRKQELESTAKGLRGLYANEDSAERHMVELVMGQCQLVRDETNEIIKAYDRESRERDTRLTKLETKLNILMGIGAALGLAMLTEFINSLVHRSP